MAALSAALRPTRTHAGRRHGTRRRSAAAAPAARHAAAPAQHDPHRHWVVQSAATLPVHLFPVLDEQGRTHEEPFYAVMGFAPTDHGIGIIARVSQKAGVLLLTDMFGGTPTNIASMFLEEDSVEVITGVNLPMVIKLATQPAGTSLTELARRICDQGRQGIYRAGDLLTPPAKE